MQQSSVLRLEEQFMTRLVDVIAYVCEFSAAGAELQEDDSDCAAIRSAKAGQKAAAAYPNQ